MIYSTKFTQPLIMSAFGLLPPWCGRPFMHGPIHPEQRKRPPLASARACRSPLSPPDNPEGRNHRRERGEERWRRRPRPPRPGASVPQTLKCRVRQSDDHDCTHSDLPPGDCLSVARRRQVYWYNMALSLNGPEVGVGMDEAWRSRAESPPSSLVCVLPSLGGRLAVLGVIGEST